MAFDLDRIRQELAAAPLTSPYPVELAAAILNDVFRRAGAAPVPDAEVARWEKARGLWREQLGMLAHILAVTSLGRDASAVLSPGADAASIVSELRAAIAPVTGEMIRANAFRQEEVLRRLVSCVGGTIQGETAAQSGRRLDALDYRKALAEYEKAEKERSVEAARREKLLQEAMAREAAARGWRE